MKQNTISKVNRDTCCLSPSSGYILKGTKSDQKEHYHHIDFLAGCKKMFQEHDDCISFQFYIAFMMICMLCFAAEFWKTFE